MPLIRLLKAALLAILLIPAAAWAQGGEPVRVGYVFSDGNIPGTLAAYRGHRVHRDALRNPGAQDLTAHIDFGSLRQTGEDEGLTSVAFLRQAAYLVAAGLFDEIAGDSRRKSEAQTLLDGEGMGEAIRVLIQARGTKGQTAAIQLFETASKSSSKYSNPGLGHPDIP